jgi:hypothetical protein
MERGASPIPSDVACLIRTRFMKPSKLRPGACKDTAAAEVGAGPLSRMIETTSRAPSPTPNSGVFVNTALPWQTHQGGRLRGVDRQPHGAEPDGARYALAPGLGLEPCSNRPEPRRGLVGAALRSVRSGRFTVAVSESLRLSESREKTAPRIPVDMVDACACWGSPTRRLPSHSLMIHQRARHWHCGGPGRERYVLATSSSPWPRVKTGRSGSIDREAFPLRRPMRCHGATFRGEPSR